MNLDTIREFCRPFLTSIHRENWCFTYFTDHDRSHTEAVWKLAQKIASGKLSDNEMEFLEAACLCHDLGMSKFYSEDDSRKEPEEEYCDFVRKNHHIRSEEFVNYFKDDLGLNIKEAFILGRICYAHSSKANLNELNDFDEYLNDFNFKKVRTKLLGGILRISDALDASEDRIPPESYIKYAPFESKIEYLKHMIVKKVNISSGQISIELSNYYDECELIKNKLIEEYDSLENLLNDENLIFNLKFEYSDTVVDKTKLSFIPKDIQRIMELYVKPSCFDEIYDKLKEHNIVIISGDANVGKTSTANYIAGLRFKENKNPILVFRPELKIGTPSNNTIIIDDAYGESKFENRFPMGYNKILELKENNKVIITSREHVLIDALREDRIGETEYKNWKVEIEQEGSYSDIALKEIIHKHLDYYLKNGKIQKNHVEIAIKHEAEIIHVLRFPHNIDIFVKEKLKEVVEGKELNDAIEESKHIKQVAMNWFLNLDDTRKFFVFTVWLFPTRMEFFEKIYLKTIGILKERKPGLEIEDINELLKKTSAYIVYENYGLNENKIHFRHENYREGISKAISESLKSYIISLGPLFRDLYKSHNYWCLKDLNNSFKRIATLNPDWAFSLVEELVNDDNWKIRAEISLLLGEFRYMKPDKSIVLLRKLADDDDLRVKEHVTEALVFGLVDNFIEFEYRPYESYELLLKLISNEDYGLKAKVAEVLGKFGYIMPDESIALLEDLAEIDDYNVKLKVAKSLGRFGHARPDKSIALLELLSNDKCWEVRKEVINALFWAIKDGLNRYDAGSKKYDETIDVGFLRFHSSFKLIKNLIHDEDSRVKGFLGYYLVMGLIDIFYNDCFGSYEYIILLNKLVDESDSSVKLAVADAISEFGYLISTQCNCLLKKLVSDDSSSVRKVCECDQISRMLNNFDSDQEELVQKYNNIVYDPAKDNFNSDYYPDEKDYFNKEYYREEDSIGSDDYP